MKILKFVDSFVPSLLLFDSANNASKSSLVVVVVLPVVEVMLLAVYGDVSIWTSFSSLSIFLLLFSSLVSEEVIIILGVTSSDANRS